MIDKYYILWYDIGKRRDLRALQDLGGLAWRIGGDVERGVVSHGFGAKAGQNEISLICGDPENPVLALQGVDFKVGLY